MPIRTLYWVVCCIFSIVGYLLVAGCATNDEYQLPETRLHRSIGVISLLGTRATLSDRGVTVFNDEYSKVEAGGWGVDALVESSLIKLINEGNRYSAHAVELSPEIRAKHESARPGSERTISRDHVQELAADKAAQTVDLLLLVVNSSGNEPSYNSSYRLFGYGFYYDQFDNISPYFYAKVYFVDVASRHVIGERDLNGFTRTRIYAPITESEKMAIEEAYSYAVRFGNEAPFILREKLHPRHHKPGAFAKIESHEKQCLGNTMLTLISRSLPGFVSSAKLVSQDYPLVKAWDAYNQSTTYRKICDE